MQSNGATATDDGDRAQAEGAEPRKRWWKRIADGLLADDFGRPDLEWSWSDQTDVDPLVQAQIDELNLRNGSSSIDEVRDRRGLGLAPGGAPLRVYTATGAQALTQPPIPSSQEPA